MSTLLTIGITNALAATVLAIIVWCVTRVWRQPAVAQLLWVLVLVKFVTPPMVSIPWQVTQEHRDVFVPPALASALPHHTTSAANETAMPMLKPKSTQARNRQIGVPIIESTGIAATRPTPWEAIAIGVWLAGSAVWILIATTRLARFHRALRNTIDCPADLQRMADDVAKKLGVTSRFRLRMTEAQLSPLVWPIGRPTIVLSRPLLAELSQEEMQTLLAHELSHLRRKDHWLRWLELFVTALYWWHPVVWWTRHMIQKAEEQACDAWVVWAFPNAATCYASALFKTAQMISDHRFRTPSVASRLGSSGNLKERIENIMNATWTCRLSFPAQVTVALAAVLILPLSWHTVSAANEAQQPAKSNQAASQKDASKQPTSTTVQSNLPLEKDVASSDRVGNAELAALREHVDFLENQFTIDALYRTGSKGGSADSRARTAYELASARAELAAAEGNRTQAIAYCEQAEKQSEEALKSVMASYEAGRVSLDLLLQTAKFVSDAKRRLAHLRDSQAPSTTQQSKADSGRVDIRGDAAPLRSLSDSGTSVKYRQAVVEVAKQKYERMKSLADQRVVPAAELESAKADYEVSVAQLQRAQRILRYSQLEVELAETELQEATAGPRTTASGPDDFELKKLKIKLEMAKVKTSALE